MNDTRVVLTVDSEFHPLLFEGDRQALGLAWTEWVELGLLVRFARGRKMRTLGGVFDEFAAALQFPIYFGENTDAFNDCISDLEVLPAGTGYVVIIVEPDQVLADDEPRALEWLVESLASATAEWGQPIERGEWWDRPALPFHVVLFGNHQQVALAATRWSSAGAEVRWAGLNLESLRALLEAADVDPSAYSLDGGFASDAFVLERQNGHWVIFYTERGLRRGEVEFDSEDAACSNLLARVLRDRSTRVKRWGAG